MTTSGFGALGEYALGEGGYATDTVIRPSAIESTSELLPAQVYAGQISRRTTAGAWGEGALGEFALGEGVEGLNTGVSVEPEVITGVPAELLAPTLQTGASVLPGVVSSVSGLLAPSMVAGSRVDVPVLDSLSELLPASTSIGEIVQPGLIEGQSAELLDPVLRTGASVLPVTKFKTSSGALGEGALGEFALGEGPAGLAYGPVLTSRSTLLQPDLRSGASVILVAPLTSTSQLLAPDLRSGALVAPGVIAGAPGELLNPDLRIGTSVLPGVITGAAAQILVPLVSAGKSVLPGVLTTNSYLLNPELDARPRRIWKQAIAC